MVGYPGHAGYAGYPKGFQELRRTAGHGFGDVDLALGEHGVPMGLQCDPGVRDGGAPAGRSGSEHPRVSGEDAMPAKGRPYADGTPPRQRGG
ncbi:hypothetical protein, partial [Streptomyces sp. SID1034]|uniref:hypothetical protein n=1 Tax=Streptomyces sp. SID1034 TaxID=2690248 RepID=UPI0013696FD4